MFAQANTTKPQMSWKQKLTLGKMHTIHSVRTENFTYFHIRRALHMAEGVDIKAAAKLAGLDDSVKDDLDNITSATARITRTP